jgi:citrate synthase
MDEAGLTAELVAALTLDRPEHTAHVLAMLAGALAVEARCHCAPTPETAVTLLALNELQLALNSRLAAVLTYQEAGPAEAFIKGLFATARDLGCAEQWRLAVCDVASALILWRLRDGSPL